MVLAGLLGLGEVGLPELGLDDREEIIRVQVAAPELVEDGGKELASLLVTSQAPDLFQWIVWRHPASKR